MPVSLKAGLFAVLEQATQLVRHKYPGAMSDSLCTKIFASLLNSRLGKPKFCNRYEYGDVVLSYNTVFPSHVEEKNDHRPGYDHCAMYTFATCVFGYVCRVTVIMTSRTAAEAWLEISFWPKNHKKIQKNLQLDSNPGIGAVSKSNPIINDFSQIRMKVSIHAL